MPGQHKSPTHDLMGWREPCSRELKHVQTFLRPFSTFGPPSLGYIHSPTLARRCPISRNSFSSGKHWAGTPSSFHKWLALQSHQWVMALSEHSGGSQEPEPVCSDVHPQPIPNTTLCARGIPDGNGAQWFLHGLCRDPPLTEDFLV